MKEGRCCFDGCGKKLTLSQRAVGKCKCGLVFCTSHRLMSDHQCMFDYKGTSKASAAPMMIPILAPKVAPI